MKSERTVRQLKSICKLLTEGYNAEYFIVAFAPEIERIVFSTKKEAGKLLASIKACKITCLKVTLPDLYEIKIDDLSYELD